MIMIMIMNITSVHQDMNNINNNGGNDDMELFFLSILLLIVIFISLSLRFFVYKHKTATYSKDCDNLPPGKTGWPIIGESFEFLNAGRKGAPEKFIKDRMKKFSSEIFKTSLLGESTVVICGAAGHKFLFSNENKLVHSWWPRSVDKIFPSSQISSSKEEAMKMRKLLPQFLKTEALRRYISIMDTIAIRHLETCWDNKEEVTVFPLAKSYTFSLACRLFLSIDDPSRVEELAKPFGILASGIISMPIDLPGMPFNRGVKASNLIRKELISIIKQRKNDLLEKKASPTQDILSHMLLTIDENEQFMSEMDIANKIIGLLIGGHDTASSTITFIVKYLAELPHVYNEVLNEQTKVAKSKRPGELLNWVDVQKMKYSWNVACEVMRLAPPLQGAFREAITDFTYAGYFVPKGWKLYWSANSTHRNPECFSNPENFDPLRFEGNGPAPYTYVPFGGGPRMCPGKEYARLEILVFMYNVVRRYKWEKLVPNEKMIFDPMPMPVKGLPIRLQPRN